MSNTARRAIASTFHPTHEITLIRVDGTHETVLVMLLGSDAYTLEEWVTNADAPAPWRFSDLGWRWYGKYAPPGYKQDREAKVRLLATDPK